MNMCTYRYSQVLVTYCFAYVFLLLNAYLAHPEAGLEDGRLEETIDR